MVYHILKDGSQVKDIRGRVVRMSDAIPLYKMIDTINFKGTKKRNKKER